MSNLIKNTISNIKKTDHFLLFLIIGFVFFGLFNIVSVSSREAISQNVNLYYYFNRHLIILLFCSLIFLIIINIPTYMYKNISFPLLIILLLFMTYSYFTVEAVRGVKSWANIGGKTFQPSELAKPLIIITLASLFEKYYRHLKNKTTSQRKAIAYILIAGLAIPAVVFIQKDLGTTLIQLFIFFILFFISPMTKNLKVKTMGFILLLLGIGIALQVGFKGHLLSDVQASRINGFRTPCKNYEEGGYQICNALIAINNGGLFGLGIGKSKQKYSYILEPHTDMVFSIMLEEYGLILMAIVFLGYFLILYRVLKISIKSVNIMGYYICIGVSVLIFSHVFINLGGLATLIPLTGVPLPFFSYGGSFMLALIISLGLVQRVEIENRNKKIKIKKIK